jgi:putative endonuclease
MNHQPCVYILTSQRNGTLYIGVISNLIKRVWEHQTNVIEGFTKKYDVHTLVQYENHETMNSAYRDHCGDGTSIQREKALKKWRRKWKIGLIESFNPGWKDLYEIIV